MKPLKNRAAAIAVYILLFALPATAQKIILHTVTTQPNGAKANLYSDGTWEYTNTAVKTIKTTKRTGAAP